MKPKMIAVIAVLGLLGALALWLHFRQQAKLHEELQTTKQDLGKQEQATDDLKASLSSYKDDVHDLFVDHSKRLKSLQRQYVAVQEDTERVNAILSRHNLTNLAYRKPGLIETRINRGTEQVFNELAQVTKEFSNEKSE